MAELSKSDLRKLEKNPEAFIKRKEEEAEKELEKPIMNDQGVYMDQGDYGASQRAEADSAMAGHKSLSQMSIGEIEGKLTDMQAAADTAANLGTQSEGMLGGIESLARTTFGGLVTGGVSTAVQGAAKLASMGLGALASIAGSADRGMIGDAFDSRSNEESRDRAEAAGATREATDVMSRAQEGAFDSGKKAGADSAPSASVSLGTLASVGTAGDVGSRDGDSGNDRGDGRGEGSDSSGSGTGSRGRGDGGTDGIGGY